MKRVRLLLAITLMVCILPGCKTLFGNKKGVQDDSQYIYQYSTLHALLEGVYDGNVTCEKLLDNGDLGLGTFNALDGELVCAGGQVYQVKSDGSVSVAEPSQKTPFAAVTFFKTEKAFKIKGKLDYDGLKKEIDARIPSKNDLVAIRVRGKFDYIKARAPKKQEKPYPKLVDALKDQPIFEFNDVSGVLVGFCLPEYVKGINATDFHLHFLKDDRSGGGHLLECKTKEITVEIDSVPQLRLSIPQSSEFGCANLAGDRQAEMEKVEK